MNDLRSVNAQFLEHMRLLEEEHAARERLRFEEYNARSSAQLKLEADQHAATLKYLSEYR